MTRFVNGITYWGQWARQRLSGGSLQANVVLLIGGASFSQAILFVVSPIISRLYTPADFGAVTAYSFLLTVLVAVNSLRYEYAIPLPQDDEDAVNLVAVCLTLVTLTSALFAGVFWLLDDEIARLLNAPEVRPLLWFLPAALLLGGYVMTLNYWLTRKKRFTTVTNSQVRYNVVQAFVQIALGVAGAGPFGLVFGHLFGQAQALFTLIRRANLPRVAVSPREWGRLIRTYRNFPLYSIWSSLLDVVGVNVPNVLFVMLFSLDAAGLLSMTFRVVRLPAGIISQAFAQSFYSHIAERQNDAEASRVLLEKLANILLIIAVPLFFFLIINGVELFAFVLGDEWGTAGRYAQYLAPSLITSFVYSPLSAYSFIKHAQRQILYRSLLMTGGRVVMLVLGGALGSPDAALILYSLLSVLVELWYINWLLRLAGSNLVIWLRQISGFLIASLAALSITALMSILIPPLATMVISLIAFGSIGLWYLRQHWQTVS